MGSDGPVIKRQPLHVDPDLLTPCDGHTGPAPATEIELAKATIAERRGRLCNAGKLEAVAEIVRLHNTRTGPS